MDASALPAPYRRTIRLLIRYAILMTGVALLSGLAHTESARKLAWDQVAPGVRLEATIHLALVHGHAMALGVFLPLALAGALVLARRAGGRDVSARALAVFVRLYLPLAAASIALLLYRGYHVLLAVRGGERDFAAIDAALLGGSAVVRYGLYGVAHVGLTLGLVVLLVALWRSLSERAPATG